MGAKARINHKYNRETGLTDEATALNNYYNYQQHQKNIDEGWAAYDDPSTEENEMHVLWDIVSPPWNDEHINAPQEIVGHEDAGYFHDHDTMHKWALENIADENGDYSMSLRTPEEWLLENPPGPQTQYVYNQMNTNVNEERTIDYSNNTSSDNFNRYVGSWSHFENVNPNQAQIELAEKYGLPNPTEHRYGSHLSYTEKRNKSAKNGDIDMGAIKFGGVEGFTVGGGALMSPVKINPNEIKDTTNDEEMEKYYERKAEEYTNNIIMETEKKQLDTLNNMGDAMSKYVENNLIDYAKSYGTKEDW